MNMDEVQQHADDSMWDNERSKLIHAYPVPLKQKVANTGLKLLEGIPEDQIGRAGIFYTAASPQTHIGPFKNAVDFLVADGTPVLASADGWIVEIQQHSETWGDGPEFRDFLNYVTINHGDEYSQYCHLTKNSVSKCKLRVGDNVKAGQQIGTVGKTGWTDRDHLHFMVFRADGGKNRFGTKSLIPRF